MSLRPEISGFSFAHLSGLLRCKDANILSKVISEFDTKIQFEDAEYTLQAHAILERVIYEGGSWPELEIESDPHVYSAIVLATHGQEHFSTQSSSWKMGGIHDFVIECSEHLPSDTRDQLSVFLGGRPLFGHEIETSWSYYGYLTWSEVDVLLAVLSRYQGADPMRRGERFYYGVVDALIKWLTLIHSNKMDMWFYCA